MILHARLLAVAFGACALFLACGDETPRTGFDETPGDAGPRPEASLPPSPPVDGSAPPPPDGADEPVVCTESPCATQLAAGEHHVCARLDDGSVQCWGDDAMGVLGRGSIDAGRAGVRPAPAFGLRRVTQISAAARTTCARDEDGAVHCWGDNRDGQLGLGTADDAPHPLPERAILLEAVTRVDVGQRTACAITSSGALHCWGRNDQQELGRPDAGAVASAGGVELSGVSVTRTAAGVGTTIALSTEGTLLAWGAVSGRQASVSPDPNPVAIPTLANVTAIASSVTHTCAVTLGDTYCWGSNAMGALCTGVVRDEAFPTTAAIPAAVVQQITTSRHNTCARLTNGTVRCCGDNTFGQMGTGAVAAHAHPTFTPTEPLPGHAVQVVASDQAACALLRSGAVHCWGGNAHGELGQGTVDDEAHPSAVKIPFEKANDR